MAALALLLAPLPPVATHTWWYASPPSPPAPSPAPVPPVPAGHIWTILSGGEYCELTSSNVSDGWGAHANNECVSDGWGAHANNEACVVRANVGLYVTATEFATETYFDFIELNGERFSGTNGPINVWLSAGSSWRWRSDRIISMGGFTLCGSTTPAALPQYPPPAPPPSPVSPVPLGDIWTIISGSEFCGFATSGRSCWTNGEGQNHGGNNEQCVVRANVPLYVSATCIAPKTQPACRAARPHKLRPLSDHA